MRFSKQIILWIRKKKRMQHWRILAYTILQYTILPAFDCTHCYTEVAMSQLQHSGRAKELTEVFKPFADDALEAEEEFEDTLGGGHDYADLATAMRQADADSDQEEEDQDLSDLDSDAEEVPSEDELVHLGSDDSAGEEEEVFTDEEADGAESSEDELNPFELAEGTDSDEDKADQGRLCTVSCTSLWFAAHYGTMCCL